MQFSTTFNLTLSTAEQRLLLKLSLSCAKWYQFLYKRNLKIKLDELKRTKAR